MKLPRALLHTIKIADAVLFWPILAFVVWGELFAPDHLPVIARINDKVLHGNAYFILAAMAGVAFTRRWPVVLAVAGLIVLGGGLEILQGMLGRDMSIYDELANTVGAILGGIVARAVVEPLRRRAGG